MTEREKGKKTAWGPALAQPAPRRQLSHPSTAASAISMRLTTISTLRDATTARSSDAGAAGSSIFIPCSADMPSAGAPVPPPRSRRRDRAVLLRDEARFGHELLVEGL